MSLAMVYALLWMRELSDPRQRTAGDFLAFYTAGRLARTAGMAQVYNPELQRDIQEAQAGFRLLPSQVLLYNHMPYLIPILAAVMSENYLASYWRWISVLVIIYTAGAVILMRFLQREGWGQTETRLAGAGMLTFFPLFAGLINGQDTALMFLGAAVWLVGLIRGRDPMAGLGLALTTVRPHIALALAIPFLFRRQKVLLWFALGAGMLGVTSLLVLGADGLYDYLNLLLISAGGEWFGMNEVTMVNFLGLLARVWPRLGAENIRLAGWIVYGLAITGLCALWARSPRLTEQHAGLAATLTAFAVPHLHYHDLTLLLIPLTALLFALGRDDRLTRREAALLPLGLSLLFLFSNLAIFLKYSIPYLTMFLLVGMLWLADKIHFGKRNKPAEV